MAEIVKNYSNGSSIKVVYSYTQNVSKNQSTITMTLYVKRDAYGPSWNTRCDAYIQLDGSKVMTYTSNFNIGTSWVKIGSTVSKTVSHNSDGTKSVSIKGFFDSLGLTSKLTDLTVTGNVALTTIPRTSSFTLSTSSVTAGSTSMTVNISRESSSFIHTVQWKLGDHTKSTTGVGTSASYTIPESWLDAIPNSTSGTGTVTVTTYNGSTKIGSSSKSFTVKAASDVVPSFTGITFTRVDGDVPSSWGVYVKTKSKVTASITGAAGVYGSTIKSYSISGGGYSGTGSSLTTGFLNTAGTVTFTAKITDSRGRTATKTASITVVDYSPPVLSSVTAFRCNSSGAEQDDGNYISVTAEFSGSSVNGKNTISGKYQRKPDGGSWSSLYSLTSGRAAVFSASSESTYIVRVQVSDAFTTVSQDVVANTGEYIMDFKAGGDGIAFGKAAELQKALESAWQIVLQQSGPEQLILHKKAGEVDNVIKFEDTVAGKQDSWYINQYTDGTEPNSLRFQTNSLSASADDFAYVMILYPDGHMLVKDSVWLSQSKLYAPDNYKMAIEVQNGQGTRKEVQWIGENGGENRFVLRTTQNGLGYLGTTSMRWNTGFFTNTITQSDLKDKENIREIPGAKAFIMALKPIAYTLKDGDTGRTHMGFGAQEVAQAAAQNSMGDLALYQAAVVEENGTESYFRSDVSDEQLCWGLNYPEFIAPLVALVQEQEERISELEENIIKIETKLSGASL